MNTNNDLISREALKKAIEESQPCCDAWIGLIDNAPTVDVSFELKTENGITYPKALDQMTFTHELSTEERHNIIKAYMLGANANIRPQGEYVDISKLRLMTVEECAGHTIEYAMGWKACIEWIKKGGAE